MINQVLGNYLRTHRRKSGLSQRELGLLLGYKDEGQVSRHERSKTAPPLIAALAYEVIFKIPVSDLFPEIHATTAQMIEGKLVTLEEYLQNLSGKGRRANAVAKKLIWLTKRRRI